MEHLTPAGSNAGNLDAVFQMFSELSPKNGASLLLSKIHSIGITFYLFFNLQNLFYRIWQSSEHIRVSQPVPISLASTPLLKQKQPCTICARPLCRV